jgi:hypothetical protein
MNADRETLATRANRSISFSTSDDRVIDIFTLVSPSIWLIGGFELVRQPYPLIWPRIARASAAGSAASVMGRPTTI